MMKSQLLGSIERERIAVSTRARDNCVDELDQSKSPTARSPPGMVDSFQVAMLIVSSVGRANA
jgi:hypothetical protein